MATDTSQDQFARLVGITQAQVSQLIRKGVLTRSASVAVWLHEYLRNLREQAAGRKSSEGHDLVAERARLSARMAEEKEIQLAKLRGELMPVAVVVDVLNFSHATIRSKLLAFTSRLKSQRSNLGPQDLAAADALIRETLNELVNVRFPREFADL